VTRAVAEVVGEFGVIIAFIVVIVVIEGVAEIGAETPASSEKLRVLWIIAELDLRITLIESSFAGIAVSLHCCSEKELSRPHKD
jgi:hypothetical protein